MAKTETYYIISLNVCGRKLLTMPEATFPFSSKRAPQACYPITDPRDASNIFYNLKSTGREIHIELITKMPGAEGGLERKRITAQELQDLVRAREEKERQKRQPI
jgi:hypothetical protein